MANIGYIQVNRYCNNKCHFCSNPSNGTSISYQRGIELIDEFLKKGYGGIIFTGGEPTLSKDLPEWIRYAHEKRMSCRIISNGSRCSDDIYMKSLKEAGLKLVHFSIYSHSEKVHDFLTDTPGSFKKVIQAIQNSLKNDIEVQINTVINRYNEDHLDKIVMFLVKNFPSIRHFVWNNLDPLMMRKTSLANSTLPRFDVFRESLLNAMKLLEENEKTFRAERIPLCYMRGFEYASTETRKIVKSEERTVYFLDEREVINDKGNDFIHDKKEECKNCDLNDICAGIYESKDFYDYVKARPQSLSPEEKKKLIDKIKIG